MKTTKTNHLFLIIFIAITTLALTLLTFNFAKAEDQATPDPEAQIEESSEVAALNKLQPLPYATYLTKLDGTPCQEGDYSISYENPTTTLHIIGNDLVLTGANCEDNYYTISIECNRIYLDTFECTNDGFKLETTKDCEIILTGGALHYAYFKGLDFQNNITISGNNGIEVLTSGANFHKDLTLNNAFFVVTLDSSAANAKAGPAMMVDGNLNINSGKLAVVNKNNGYNNSGLTVTGKATLNNAQIFISGFDKAIKYAHQGDFNNLRGAEERITNYEDYAKVTNETEEFNDEPVNGLFTRIIAGTSSNPVLARTVTSYKPPTPPTPEPDPSITAQTGDPLAIAVIGLIILAIASGVVCAIIYKRKHH